jgi:hypothetical protein
MLGKRNVYSKDEYFHLRVDMASCDLVPAYDYHLLIMVSIEPSDCHKPRPGQMRERHYKPLLLVEILSWG